MKRPSEKAALILVSLVAVVVVAFLAASMASDRRRTAALEQVQRPASMEAYARYAGTSSPERVESENGAGEAGTGRTPRSKPARPSDPDRTIAGYQRLFDGWLQRNTANPELLDISTWKGPFDELSPEDKIRFIELFEANQDFLEEIRQMARAGGPVYPLDFSVGYQMALPHLAQMREFTRLLCRDAVIQAHGGNLDLAVEDLIAGMQLGDALAGEPLLISQLVRIATYSIVSEGMTDALPPGAPSSRQTARLVAQLAQADNRQAFADSLSGETVRVLAWFERVRGGDSFEPLSSPFTPFDVPDSHLRIPPGLYVSALARPWFNNDEAVCAEMMAQISQVAVLPYYESEPTLTLISEEIDELPRTRILSRLLLPQMAHVSQAQARHEANVDLMQMGLLLEQYYADHGVYPETFDPIASSLGGALPVDPFTGESYTYQPAANSFLLYGVGLNRTDDGGLHDPNRADIVWRGRQPSE